MGSSSAEIAGSFLSTTSFFSLCYLVVAVGGLSPDFIPVALAGAFSYFLGEVDSVFPARSVVETFPLTVCFGAAKTG